MGRVKQERREQRVTRLTLVDILACTAANGLAYSMAVGAAEASGLVWSGIQPYLIIVPTISLLVSLGMYAGRDWRKLVVGVLYGTTTWVCWLNLAFVIRTSAFGMVNLVMLANILTNAALFHFRGIFPGVRAIAAAVIASVGVFVPYFFYFGILKTGKS